MTTVLATHAKTPARALTVLTTTAAHAPLDTMEKIAPFGIPLVLTSPVRMVELVTPTSAAPSANAPSNTWGPDANSKSRLQ